MNFEPNQPARLVVHTGPIGLAGILLQEDPEKKKHWVPVGSYSRTFSTQELLLSRPALEIIACQEALGKLRHMTTYAGQLEVGLSDTARALIKGVNRVSTNLMWQIVDILSYKPTLSTPFQVKNLEWCGGNEWADEVIEDDDDEDPLKIPEVRLPARLCSKSLFRRGHFIHAAFDGGSADSVGTAGFVIALSTG